MEVGDVDIKEREVWVLLFVADDGKGERTLGGWTALLDLNCEVGRDVQVTVLDADEWPAGLRHCLKFEGRVRGSI